jgi:ketosteroid isomerase-like protein
MKPGIFLSLCLAFLFYSCNSGPSEEDVEAWKKEIVATEAAFAKMVAEDGIMRAFLAFGADDAVLDKGKRVIVGKEAMRAYYKERETRPGKVTVTWKPDFVDVAASGDLGYTYGKAFFTKTDTSGVVKIDSGIFHTVWKRQPNGKWKFVWD